MRVDLFDFDLPEDLIALRPAMPRSAARMLLVGADGTVQDHTVADLPSLLTPADLMVVNDTQVIPARLHGIRDQRGGQAVPPAGIELLLHKRIDATGWWAFARPAKKLASGDRVTLHVPDGEAAAKPAHVRILERRDGGEVMIRFDIGADEGVERVSAAVDAVLSAAGEMPLPPYIAGKRATDERDRADYQTVFARMPGAVAAPTAALHFDDALLQALDTAGIARTTVTLHIGAGTFLPVKAADTREHMMHAEWGQVSAAAAERLNAARAAGGRIVAVGTTALRLLESAVDRDGRFRPFADETDIFITPGYRFRAVDVLLTNFHLPRSTLFMLVAAFSGLQTMQSAYAHAIAERYRFYSYGDATLLVRPPR